ncbi:related to vesicular amine transporter [Rhynchosporium agropyri]|uniref:Related to vesicular amine transporter n=2 Tax=Rhynchosporium TaxID=38037 RepID=A0A1E1K4Q3_9HELO|nr:related to vesicular amine transporter [Rhynchosporium agropyri]
MASNTIEIMKRPWLWEVRSSTWFIVLAVSSGVFTDLFLYGIIIPVIPHAIVNRAHVSPKHRQEWVTILLATEAATYLVTSPIFGYLSDHARRPTRRLPYLSGLVLLTISMILQAASRSTTVYLIGRSLQGASSSAIWVIGLAIIVDSVESNQIGRYMGYFSLAMSVGNLLGPLLGGIVLEYGGYYAVFGMAFAVLGVDATLRFCMIEKSVVRGWKLPASESQSAILTGTALASTLPMATVPSSGSETDGEKSSVTVRVSTETSTEDKDVDKGNQHSVFSLLKSPRLLFTLWACMVPALILAAFESTLPITVLQKFHWDSVGGGLIFITLTLPTFLSPLTGQFSDKHGARLCATLGFLGMVPPLVCLRFVNHNTLSQKVLLCVLLTFTGLGVSIVYAPGMAEVERIVAERESDMQGEDRDGGEGTKRGGRASAYGLVNMAYAFGILCGPLVGGFVKKEGGLATLGWALGLISGVTGIGSYLMIGGWIGSRRARKRESRSMMSSN